jgi:hypothetical protein
MTTLSISPLPVNAACRCLLADGCTVIITASRRPRSNRADVKCSVPNAPAIAERMQEVVRLARHTEARLDTRDQVVLSMDITPDAGQRGWELAAVLADRMVRGVHHHRVDEPAIAQGWSDRWHLGQVNDATVGDTAIGHLGALSGHADLASAVSSVRTWFPLHSGGINDALAWVEVSVFAIDSHCGSEEETISAPGLDLAAQQDVRHTLAGARHFDGHGPGRWRTVVRFGQARFHGGSYQLALVMADRLARGREFVPRGRIIATGTSSAWHAGLVETVEGREPKLALIGGLAGPGDRVLLPGAWQPALPPGFAAELRQKGASVACIDRIGMI